MPIITVLRLILHGHLDIPLYIVQLIIPRYLQKPEKSKKAY